MGGRQHVVGSDGNRRLLVVAPADEVGQVAARFPREESLVFQPELVVELGEILVTGIAGKRNDVLRLVLLLAVLQRSGKKCTAR